MATTKKTAKKEQPETKVVSSVPARISYAHVFKPTSVHPDKPDTLKYSCVLMIPKKEKALMNEIKRAIQAATENGIETVKAWKGVKPKRFTNPLRDGDEVAEEGKNPEYAGHWLLSPKSDRRPGIIDKDKEPLTSDDDFYSGVWARFSIKFYPYGTAGNNGIGVQLNHLQKVKDGERFGVNIASADEDFEDDWEDDDDDEGLMD